MPHIHTEPGQHDHTASAFIIRTDGAEPRLMLHMHRKVGKWMYFGGHIELDENPWQAISHEISEETGYQLEQLRILQPSIRMGKVPNAVVHPTPLCHLTAEYGIGSGHSHIDTIYAFVTKEEPAGAPHTGESTDIRLVTFKELTEMEPALILDICQSIGIQLFTSFLNEWHEEPLSNFDN